MNETDYGYLLLSSHLGNPERKPLSTAQLRLVAQTAAYLPKEESDRDLTLSHLINAGVEVWLAKRTLALLEEELQLKAYLARAKKLGCVPVTRADENYPPLLRQRLGLDAPGCLWAKGDLEILKRPTLALVGSRDLREDNRKFARQVGIQAARQGFTLVSGNARGADTVAQNACLEAGGCVISVLADSLEEHAAPSRQLLLSEDDFDEGFSIPRALHRNRVIHALGAITVVAQCALEKGGTWEGSTKNLHQHWSPLYCFQDGSPASERLEQMGASLIEAEQLENIGALPVDQINFLDLE